MKYLLFDIETTGLNVYNDDICQFAYIILNEKFEMVKAEELFFYYDGMHVSPESYEVHHLSAEFLKQYEDKFIDNLAKMHILVSRANVIGHNADKFDYPFVRNFINRFGLPDTECNSLIDTVSVFKPYGRMMNRKHAKGWTEYIGKFAPTSVSLEVLPKKLGIDESTITVLEEAMFGKSSQQHNACYDCIATYLCLMVARKEGLLGDV